MAVFNYNSPGLGSVGSYQVSGKPFVSASLNARVGPLGTPLQIKFPSVTRWIQVINHDASNALSCSFSSLGLSDTYNYFRVSPQIAGSSNAAASQRLELKVGEMFFTGSNSFDLIVGLTGIESGSLHNNWSGSSGVG